MKKTILITALCLAAFALVSFGGGNWSSNSSGSNASGSKNGHEYVDLGLPSGTLWATCNVGANSPQEYGNYYAWGEVTPKSVYNWSTYAFCNGSFTTLTKYNTNSEYGTVDNRTVLDLSDDVAHVVWGGDWRMPTEAEMKELVKRCKWKWTNLNNVNGYRVVGPNGNTIFLPAGGYRYKSELYSVGSFGNYWTSSLYAGVPNGARGPADARDLNFGSGRHRGIIDFRRHSGLTVRPVRR